VRTGHSEVLQQTYYRWKAKYGGMEVNDAKKLKRAHTGEG
jgi:hypothetical protein